MTSPIIFKSAPSALSHWVSQFAAVRDGHWYWGLGDPDLGAVLVTGLYFLTGVISLVVARWLSRSAGPLIRAVPTFSPGIGREGQERGKRVRSQKCEAPDGPYRLLTPDPVSAPTDGHAHSSGLRPPSPPASGEKGHEHSQPLGC